MTTREMTAMKRKIELLEKINEFIPLMKKRQENIESALADIKDELKVLKVFIGRIHPEFKKQSPEIFKKLTKR